ncbi:serine protease 53-like [Odontomachus brunneus]|uniref:serine protease 53-like n=1 Tax=Odontomachus brunneus TaxID=486640 RepID=UPI0013F2A0C3|nr:serine protease 53-like [Odontomachus brunneus]
MKLAIMLVVGVIAKVYGDEPEPIMGGNTASPGQFPHLVSIREDGHHICGGSIIDETRVLTAAHCISSQSTAQRLTILTGTNDVEGRGGKVHQVQSVQVHPEYDPWSEHANDIAVLTMVIPIRFNNLQRSISLANKDYADGQTLCIVSGWGLIGRSSFPSPMLQYLQVTALRHSECQKAYPGTTDKQICTYISHGKRTCMGDSGGPLICNGQLAGIVSWGNPCTIVIEIMKLAILLIVGVIVKVYGDEPEPIVGGNIAYPGQFPHQVSIREDDEHICGGTIISSTHIVTAAHCISSLIFVPDLTVRTGTNNVDSGGQVHKVKCAQIHPQYDSRGHKNDIAVLTLASPMSFNSQQVSIPLASKDYANGKNHAIVSGWGQLGANSGSPTMLQYVDVRMLSYDECQEDHPSTSFKQICTYNSYGKGLCMGDSGGPLIFNDQLVGVVSWGIPCAVGRTDVFTSVYYYRDWIRECQQMC